jgi:protein-tyrosine phosphatase
MDTITDSSSPLEWQTSPEQSAHHNFGAASTRDKVLFTAERPGSDRAGEGVVIPAETVIEWTSFMKDNGIRHILMLLDDNELEDYAEPGLVKLYENAGFKVHHEPMLIAGAPNRIFDIIQQAESNGERVVAHCTHGMGRSGRVSAAWLVNRYGLSPEEATKEVMEQAEKASLVRLGNPTKLQQWLNTCSLNK